MSLIADGLLIATCLTAAIYCYVLSRRLKQFSDTGDGIGQQILQLNTALEETRSAMKEAQGSAKKASDALAREVTEARKMAKKLDDLLQATPGQVNVLQKTLDEAAITKPAAGSSPAEAAEAEAPEPATPEPGTPEPAESGTAEEVVAEAAPMEAPAPDADIAEETPVEDLPDSPTGTEQLGFVPDGEDADFDEDETEDKPESEVREAPVDAAGETQKGSFSAAAPIDIATESEAGSEPKPDSGPVEGSAPSGGEGLLKVERMAL